MGQYKVPQNVEAEDHILGPLTFKQFIYALMGFGWAAVSFGLLHFFIPLMIVVGFPPTMLLLLLAFYTRDGQNFEQILIALADFFAAPRKRLWVKDDVAETFHVEPTKHAAEMNQRNPIEVRSELEKLSSLIDSRGWNQPSQPEPNMVLPSMAHEDRLVVPPPAPRAPDEPKTDMLDLQRSPLAQNLAELLREAAEDVREEAIGQMTAKPLRRSATSTVGASTMAISTSGVTPGQPGDILKLATQSDDLTVSQIAAQATRMAPTAGGQVVDVRTSGS
ncbi:MAG TPA: PrgI family protein [Candidatus Saccharimonadia bacterium]|nr:PrgI family protein [Candidatus Saccharimonadia bacterium]